MNSEYPTQAKVRTVQIRSQLEISSDGITSHQLQQIGKEKLDVILWKAFENSTGTVKYFSPGSSGAMLFEVTARMIDNTSSQPRETSWILKVSQDRIHLEKEIENHMKLRKRGVSKEYYPTLLLDNLVCADDWYAITTEKEKDSQTLYSYLTTDKNAEDIVNFLDSELKQFLSQLYGASEMITRLIWQKYYEFTHREAAAILATLDDRRTTFTCQSGVQIKEALARIEKFVNSNGTSERRIHELRKDVDTRFIHGDFHARNILVNTTRKKITTIDFPNSKQDHAVKDFTKLESDLIFSVMDSKNGVDTDWHSLQKWQPILDMLEMEKDFFGCCRQSKTITDVSYAEIISNLRCCAISILPTISKTEYLVSLLYYTIKILPYPDISLPKKAFAIQYANKIIENLANNV